MSGFLLVIGVIVGRVRHCFANMSEDPILWVAQAVIWFSA